jgi:thiol-disulfide isomerase/thioredoxin
MIAAVTDHDKERIRRWGRGLDGDITLRYAATGHAMDQRFKSFVDQMADLVPRVRAKKDGDAMVSLPTLFVGNHVGYQALPLDRELELFLAVLGDGSAFADRITPDDRQRLLKLPAPALVKVYITPHCPFCPATVSILLGLAACSDQVRVTVIDGELFVDAAQKDRVSAAPTVILDDRFRWTGSVDAGELVTLMLDRDPADLGADALRGMIEDGNAEGVARMMGDRGVIFPSFIDLLIHPRWSVRLGAMVSFETLVEIDPEMAGEVVDPLVAVFADVDDGVKGDLIHVLGESGNRVALPFLAAVSSGDYDEEVLAAAEEAIEKLD